MNATFAGVPLFYVAGLVAGGVCVMPVHAQPVRITSGVGLGGIQRRADVIGTTSGGVGNDRMGGD
jgi:hypothetical protein